MTAKVKKAPPRPRETPAPTPVPVRSLIGPELQERLSRTSVILTLIAVAVLIFYSTPLFDSNTSVQWDTVDVHYSAQKYFSEMLWSGKIPSWTPYVFSGMPFLADPQIGAWYPLNWPFFLIGITPAAMQWELALHCFLAFAGTFLLARDLLKCLPGALAAGACYAMSGFFAGHSSHLGMFQTAALLPWLLFTANRALRSPRFEWLLATSLTAGSLILAGHFQTALYSFVALTLFLIARIAADAGILLRAGAVLAGTVLLALALSAVQVLPGLELTAHSVRAGADYSRETNAPLVVSALATLLSPNTYGSVTGPYKGPPDVTQFYFYGGLSLLPLAVFGAVRSRLRWYGLLLVVPCFWYALGPSAGLYRVVAQLPAFKSVRAPVHIWFVIAFGLALLCGAGLNELRNWIRSPLIYAGILLFLYADLWYWNMDQNILAFARSSFQELYGANYDRYQNTIVNPMRARPLYRIWAPSALAGFGPMNSSLESHTEAAYGYNPLELSRYAEYLEAANANPKLLDGLSVTAKVEPWKGMVSPSPSALPRATFPPTLERASSMADAKAMLRTLDPSHSAIVENAPPSIQQDKSASAQIRNYEGTLYRIHYTAASESLLRMAVPFFPGWRASVDSRSLSVIPADLALTGIVVPAGTHDVTFEYKSNWLRTGALISLISALLTSGAFAWFSRRLRSQ